MSEEIKDVEPKELSLKERIENLERFAAQLQQVLEVREVRFNKHTHLGNKIVFYNE